MDALEITEEMKKEAGALSELWKVPLDLHASDHLLRHIIKRWGIKGGVARYYKGGRSDAAKVCATIERLAGDKESPKVLDFAAGYGRVVRHVKPLLPRCEVFAADIHREACDFMESRLGIKSFVSGTNPAEVSLGKEYDFIYVMSLFSHLPDKTFGRWLAALVSALVPGGFLLFTTHGMAALENEQLYRLYDDNVGFGYAPKSEQPDIDGDEYGTMVVSMSYVLRALAEHAPAARVRAFQAGAWMASQDEWIVQLPAPKRTASRLLKK